MKRPSSERTLTEEPQELKHQQDIEKISSSSKAAGANSAKSPTTTSTTPAVAPTDPSSVMRGSNGGDDGKKNVPAASTNGDGAAVKVADPADVEAARPRDIYDRFSPARKHWIVAIVSFTAFIGPIASSAFLPSISIMAHDLHTTEAMINYTVAIFICSVGIAPLIWSPLSGFYGRKPILLASMPIMTVASIGVAQSKTLGAIIGTRILQGIGSSAVLSVGAGTVGDIYRPTERANAMAWFYSGVLLGPALAPVLAGVFTQYTPATWRSTQYFLCGSSALAVLLTALFLPETSHPPTPHAKAKAATGKKFVPYLFNPLTCLGLMRYPNVVTTTMASSFVMLEIYCVMVPMSVIFKERYNITNVAVSGCLYLSTGIGTLIGSRIAGPQADRTVRKYITKRGYRRPEDRLHASLFGAGFLSPVSCLAYGWLLQANKGGLWPPLVMLVINGIGMQLALTPVNTYLVDANQTRSAQALASNNCIRYLFAAAASAFVLPLVEAVGLGWTLIVAAAAQWVGFGAILVTMVWGEKWRERVAAREDGPVEKKEEAVDEGLPSGTVEAEAEKEKEKENCSKGAAETAARRPRRESVVTVEEAHGHDDHDHGEAEHGEPSHLPGLASLGRRLTRGRHEREASAGGSAAAGGGGVLARERSRRGSSSTLPSAGEMLQRTVSLGGASVHGGV